MWENREAQDLSQSFFQEYVINTHVYVTSIIFTFLTLYFAKILNILSTIWQQKQANPIFHSKHKRCHKNTVSRNVWNKCKKLSIPFTCFAKFLPPSTLKINYVVMYIWMLRSYYILWDPSECRNIIKMVFFHLSKIRGYDRVNGTLPSLSSLKRLQGPALLLTKYCYC